MPQNGEMAARVASLMGSESDGNALSTMEVSPTLVEGREPHSGIMVHVSCNTLRDSANDGQAVSDAVLEGSQGVSRGSGNTEFWGPVNKRTINRAFLARNIEGRCNGSKGRWCHHISLVCCEERMW